MQATVLGTGTPVAQESRAGQSVLVSVGEQDLLLDCGPSTVERLLENDTTIREIEHLFITHQHMDHNAAFFHFAIMSWIYGRRALSVYGPNSGNLVDALELVYEEDIAWRKEIGRPTTGVTDIESEGVVETVRSDEGKWEVTSHEVDHSVETYAYRVEDLQTGDAVVYSADTSKISSLSEFARGADVLIQNCGVGPALDDPQFVNDGDRISWEQYLEVNREPNETPIREQHCNPHEAAVIAEEAGVEKVVLTHILPGRDVEQFRATVEDEFSGEVYIGEDGLTLET